MGFAWTDGSRLEQRRAVPESTPDFAAVDPFDDAAFDKIDLAVPFWLKPVKAYSSVLGFKINSRADFDAAIVEIREEIERFAEPVDQLLQRLDGVIDIPAEIRRIGGCMCIAEQFIGGRELAPEGYVFEGEVHVHGMFDLHMHRNGKSIVSIEYPSQPPRSVQERAEDVTRRIIQQVGMNNQCFNVEFFWDEERDKLWIIEINTRIPKTHSELFLKVDGTSNHQVAIEVATGQRPTLRRGSGKFDYAGNMIMRLDDDGVLTRVRSDKDMARLRDEQPETQFFPGATTGDRSSELPDQNPYSFAVADLYIGADSPQDLSRRFERCRELLPFELEP